MRKFTSVLFISVFVLALTTCTSRQEKSSDELRKGEEALFTSDFNTAKEHFDEAIRLDANNARAYFLRANVYVSLKGYDLAMEDYNFTLELDSANADAWFNRGNLHSILGERYDACSDYKRAYELGKQNIWDKVKNCPDPPERNH